MNKRCKSYLSRIIGGLRGEVDPNGEQILLNIYDEHSSSMFTFADDKTFLRFLSEIHKSYEINVVGYRETYASLKKGREVS